MSAAPAWTGIGRCTGCHRQDVEVASRREHDERVLCDECAAKPYRMPSATGLDAPKPPASSATPQASSVAEEAGRRVNVTSASAITPRPVEWLYEERVPLGKLTVVAGRPGLGKSLWTVLLAAHTSKGALPGSLLHTAGCVLLATAEDDPQDTVVPRLMAAGADLERVGLLDLTAHDENGRVVPGTIALPGDVPMIAEHVRRLKARLIVVDPITGYLDGAHSAYSNQEVRRALAPLAQLARDEHCAVVAVMHLNKSTSTDPLARIADSGAFTALARSVLLFGADPDDPDGDHGSRRVLTIAKGNLKAAGTQALTLAVAGCTVAAHGQQIATARIDITGSSTATAEDVLGGADERSASEEARRFLEVELADGAVLATKVQAAARDAGISDSTLNRVKRKIGVRSTRPGGTGPWLWELQRRYNPNGHLDHLDHLDPDLEHLDRLDSQDALNENEATEHGLVDQLAPAFDASEIDEPPEHATIIDLTRPS